MDLTAVTSEGGLESEAQIGSLVLRSASSTAPWQELWHGTALFSISVPSMKVLSVCVTSMPATLPTAFELLVSIETSAFDS